MNYAVRRFPGYGKLSGKSLDDLRAGERVDVDSAQARSARLRAVEARQAGRAELAFAVGRRPPGLAHRVLGDELHAARRAVRHPRRRHGPAVPAPRERDRAVRRRDAASRSSTTGCTTASCSVDDEKMSKSLGNFFTVRDVLEALRRRGGALLHPARALPQPAQLLRRAPGRRQGGAHAPLHGAAATHPAPGEASTGASRTRSASRRRWTTTSARPRRSPCCSSSRTASTPGKSRCAAQLQGAGRRPRPAAARAERVPAGRAGGVGGVDHRARSPSARRPASARISPKPTASARSCSSSGIVARRQRRHDHLAPGVRSGLADDQRTGMLIHPLLVRITHWINVLAVLIMVTSGWRIYNASPLFDFNIPGRAHARRLARRRAAVAFRRMWLLALNGLVYLAYGIVSRPLPPQAPADLAARGAARHRRTRCAASSRTTTSASTTPRSAPPTSA